MVMLRRWDGLVPKGRFLVQDWQICFFVCFAVCFFIFNRLITISHNTTVNVDPLNPPIYSKIAAQLKTKRFCLFWFFAFAIFNFSCSYLCWIWVGRNACPPFVDWSSRRNYAADGRISHTILGPKNKNTTKHKINKAGCYKTENE